jgi:lipopolysaccharide transport system ATP-binding protein
LIIRDHLGQAHFGENTFLTYSILPLSLAGGLIAEFHFDLPHLPTRSYAVRAAVSGRNLSDTSFIHWYDEGLLFEVASNFTVRGLVGLPILAIDLRREQSNTASDEIE